MSDSLIKRRADLHFSTLPGIDDGKTIMSESEAIAAAVAAKSARLKELRLARDAAEQAAPAILVKKAAELQEERQEKTPDRIVVGLAEEPPSRGTQPLKLARANLPRHVF